MLLKKFHISKAYVHPKSSSSLPVSKTLGQLTLPSGVLYAPTSLPSTFGTNLRGPCPESLISLDVEMIHRAKVHTPQHPPTFVQLYALHPQLHSCGPVPNT